MSRTRAWLWPVPPAAAATVFAGVLAASGLRSWVHIGALVADWQAVSGEFREALALAGPVAGLGSLWVATRFNARRGMLVPVAAARAGVGVVARQVLVVLGVAAVALAAGLAPAVGDAAARATSGGPDWLVIASGLPALAAYVALGSLIGAALPPLPALVSGLCAFLGLTLFGPMAGPRWFSVAPVWTYGSASAGFYENPVVTGFRIAFFAAAAVCLAAAAAVWVERRSAETVRHSAAGLAVLAVPALMVGLAGLRSPHSVVRDSDPPQACQPVSGVEVCVHAAHAPLLAEFAAVSKATLAAAGTGLAADVEQVLDGALVGETDPPRRVRLHLQTRFNREFWPGHAARDLAAHLSGWHSCFRPDGLVERQDPFNVAWGLWDWIYARSGYAIPDLLSQGPGTEVFERLEEVGDERAHAWIAERHDELLACQVASDDLP